MKKKFLKIIIGILLIVCLVTFSFSLYKIINWEQDNEKTQEITDIINEETEIIETETNENTELINAEKETKESIYWSYINMKMINVDISKLKKKNKDTKGWIQVNGTNINYPFVQTSDNKYYLTHSFDKKYTDAGWIFLDYRNDIDNLSKNNIIYGHARLDKTMFGTLKKVLTKDWYNNTDNHIIKMSTSKYNYSWQIFSVYSIKTENYYITTDFNNDKDFEEFIKTMKKRSKYKFNANVDKDDTLLTLSTCHNTNEKIVVHAKLIKREAK